MQTHVECLAFKMRHGDQRQVTNDVSNNIRRGVLKQGRPAETFKRTFFMYAETQNEWPNDKTINQHIPLNQSKTTTLPSLKRS